MDLKKHRLDHKYPCLKGTIFIITYGRSGSTLLQSILQSIPDAHITGENDNLMLLIWKAFRRANGTKRAWSEKGGNMPNNPWYGTHNFRPQIFANRLVDAFIDEIIFPPENARWIGFKEIRYDEYGNDLPAFLNFLNARFKNSYFVFNTRDANAVASSGWWKTKDKNDVLNMVHAQDERFKAYQRDHPNNSFLTSYEDVTTNPCALEPLFKMIGEPFDLDAINSILGEKLTH